MTDAPGNLNDFFNAHKKKDKKKSKASKAAADEKPAEEKAAATSKTETEQAAQAEKPSADAHDTQVATKSKKKTNTFDDSEEEEANIVLRDELRSKLKDKKDVDAVRRNEEEKKNEAEGLGWQFGGRTTAAKATPAPEPVQKPSAGGAGGAGTINFNKGRPMFTNKTSNSKVIQKQEFPELGDFAAKKTNEVLKKDGDYGANESKGSAASNAPPREQRERVEFKMPMFTGKAKLNFGTGEEDTTTTKQYNYDMSTIKKSTASSKPVHKPDGERPNRAAGGGFGDDDFETVTEKKKERKPRTGGFRRDDD